MAAATTSGTVGQTTIRVASIIEHALRRAGMKVTDITPDISLSARENLYFLLVSLSNKGVNLWTIQKSIIGLLANQGVYTMPTGTIDILNGLYRTITLPQGGTAFSSNGGSADLAFDTNMSTACVQNATNGYISYDFGQSVIITNAGFAPFGVQTYSLAWESSLDNITWTPVISFPANVIYADGIWTYSDIDVPVPGRYFRVRETGGGTISMRSIVFGQFPNDIPLGRMNFDMYTNIVQKINPVRQPTQFWYNRQINPTVTLYQYPNYSFDQLVIWHTTQIQDVGSLSNILQIPQRWYDAVVNELALRMLFEIPGADLTRATALSKFTDIASLLANAEERDPSPVDVQIDIGAYTR